MRCLWMQKKPKNKNQDHNSYFIFFTGNTFHKINNKTAITIVDICLARVSSFKKNICTLSKLYEIFFLSLTLSVYQTDLNIVYIARYSYNYTRY